MGVARPSNLRVLGYVRVKVASKVYTLPVAALPMLDASGLGIEPGFFAESAASFGIFVDDSASDSVKRETIARASVEAARHIAHKFFN
jgi:hypothetical protein